MSIELIGSEAKVGASKFVTSFEAWKLKTGNMLPKAQEAWDYQQSKIDLWENVGEMSAQTIADLRTILDELKKFNEENLKLIGELEIENLKLKGKLPKEA